MPKQFPLVLRLLFRPLLIALLLVFMVAFLFVSQTDFSATIAGSWETVTQLVRQSLQTIAALGMLGVLGFMGLYVLATLFVLPCTVLTLSAGVLYGPIWGVVYVFVGALLGATSAFLLGRYVLRDWVEQTALSRMPTFQAIRQAVGDGGAKVVLLTRLSPLFPFSLLSYAYALTPVSLGDYLLGSIGMLPATVLYVYSASLVGDLASLAEGDLGLSGWVRWGQWGLRLLGLAATIGVTWYVTRLARQALATVEVPSE